MGTHPGSCPPPKPRAGQPDPGPPHLVDVIELEVLEQEQQHSRNGFDDDLLVPIDVHPQLHALQHCGPAGHRGILGLGHCPHPASPRSVLPPPSSCSNAQLLAHHGAEDGQVTQEGSAQPQPKPRQPAPLPSSPGASARPPRSLTASPPARRLPGC